MRLRHLIDVRNSAWKLFAAAVGLALTITAGAGVVSAQIFLPDDPIHLDPDTVSLPKAPEEFLISDAFNALQVTFTSPADWSGEALNVNTLGNVPNSSWYESRLYAREMSTVEVARGPNRTGGPAGGPWMVIDLKTEGVTPGLTIRDARGDIYLIKFDSPKHPAMASGPEVISTKIYYALGYHVPENYVVHFEPERMIADTSEGITPADVDSLVSGLTEYAEGRRRALASLFLAGRPIGPFAYAGRRSDDPNDLFPHEARRELRGMRLLAAWLEHFDSRAQNTLDMVVEKSGGNGSYIKHHMIDFGSTLGGGAQGPKRLWYGHEYALEPRAILVRTLTFGFGASRWVDYEYPDVPFVGRFTSNNFDPAHWKPAFPNPAFRQMDARDAFWMAKQIIRFSDEDLDAIVETARYPDPAAASYVSRVLKERRDLITNAYLGLGGGIDRFRVETADERLLLRFDDLLERNSRQTPEKVRAFKWFTFENEQDPRGRIRIGDELSAGTTSADSILLPPGAPAFLVVEISTPDAGATRVFLRASGERYEVVGVQRRDAGAPWARGWG